MKDIRVNIGSVKATVSAAEDGTMFVTRLNINIAGVVLNQDDFKDYTASFQKLERKLVAKAKKGLKNGT